MSAESNHSGNQAVLAEIEASFQLRHKANNTSQDLLPFRLAPLLYSPDKTNGSSRCAHTMQSYPWHIQTRSRKSMHSNRRIQYLHPSCHTLGAKKQNQTTKKQISIAHLSPKQTPGKTPSTFFPFPRIRVLFFLWALEQTHSHSRPTYLQLQASKLQQSKANRQSQTAPLTGI